MPSTKENFPVCVPLSDRVGAGGEPLGEPQAPPSEILGGLPDGMRDKLPDELHDAATAKRLVSNGRG